MSAQKKLAVGDLSKRVGEEIGVSPWLEVTQERIDLFAKAIDDPQWIHIDPERAKKGPFGTTIAHGFLTLSLLSHLIESTFAFEERRMGINYGLNKVRFTAPLPSGSRIRARFVLAKYEPIEGNGVQNTWSVSVEREGGDKPVLIAVAYAQLYLRLFIGGHDMTQRWKQRPPGSNWGEFGPDDQRGRMNYVTREKILQGVAEVKEGIAFCLSLPLDFPGGNVLNPRRLPPRQFATVRDSGKGAGMQNFCYPMAEDNPDVTDVVCDDVVLMTLQYSTQWDSFAHVGSLFDADGDGTPEIVFYNGFRAKEHVKPAAKKEGVEQWAQYEGAKADALGIQNLAEHGAQGRGVMIDLHAHYGRERKPIGYDDLMRVLEADKVVVEKGDMVCTYTGFADVILELAKAPDAKLLNNTGTGLDGRDEKLLQWVTDSGLAVLISDNYAVEIIPTSIFSPRPHAAMPLHEHCLFKNGIHLGEMWYLTELAKWLRAHKRSRFLLTAPPLRLPGAVGSPSAAVATV